MITLRTRSSITRRGRRLWTAAPIAAATCIAATVLAGCSGVINQGGDTTCKDFLTQDDGQQNAAVTKMLKDESKSDPPALRVSAASAAALAFCKTVGSEKSKISDAPHL